MKITVEKEELQKKLSDIQNIVEKKNTRPILSHFLLIADKTGNYIMATDLETAFKEPIELTVINEGRVCLPAKKLFEIVRELEGTLSLESTDNQWFKGKAGKSNFRIACLSPDEFPVWPSLEGAEGIEISSQMLLEMIDKTLYAAGESETRYVLNGLLFHLQKEGLFTVVGTDGHRLAISMKKAGTSLKDEIKVIVSRKSVSELRRFLSDDDTKTVKIDIGKNHILFGIDRIQFLTRLIDGNYPNYEQVIPASNEHIVKVDRIALTKSLRRVSTMSKERSNAVKVEINAGNTIISASNPDIGEIKDEFDVEYAGEQMTFAFNARYMLDVLNAMNTEKVMFKLNEALSPALMLEEGKEDYKCVIMPMRL
ncbi:MAG: DNA polymerase III subunit beta [Nitrospirae bacterium]|nr:DNA polymerase III subunit beta [Nitrospirota bacterium]